MASHVHGAEFDAWLDFNPSDCLLHHVSIHRPHDLLLQCSTHTACTVLSCPCPYGKLTKATAQWLQDVFG